MKFQYFTSGCPSHQMDRTDLAKFFLSVAFYEEERDIEDE